MQVRDKRKVSKLMGGSQVILGAVLIYFGTICFESDVTLIVLS